MSSLFKYGCLKRNKEGMRRQYNLSSNQLSVMLIESEIVPKNIEIVCQMGFL